MPRPTGDLDRAFARRAAKAAKLPEIEASTSYGTPSLKIRCKGLMRVKHADTLVLMCPLEEKEMLIAAAPRICFETDHYKGWPAILVRLAAAGDAELRHCLTRAWRMQAPKRLRAAFEAKASAADETTKRRKSLSKPKLKRSRWVR